MPRQKPTEPDDELTLRLRAAIRKKRPWTWPSVLLTFLLVAIPLGLLLLWLWPRPDPPQLVVVAFDQVGALGQEERLHARLTPRDPEAAAAQHLEGWEVVFEEGRDPLKPGGPPDRVETTSGESGGANVSWWLPKEEGRADFLVRYIGDRQRRGAEDRARVFAWPAETALLLVDVQALAQADTEAWEKKNILDIPPITGAAEALQAVRKRGYQIIYLALDTDRPLLYRKMRGWVENRSVGKAGMPAGPVLGRAIPGEEDQALGVLTELPQRFRGAIIAVAGTPRTADLARRAGLVTFLHADGEARPDAFPLESWKDLPGALKANRKAK